MYTTLPMKVTRRVNRLVWRMASPYSIFVGSIILSYTALKAFATSAGPADTHRKRMSADGTYKKRHYPEVNDSPLYRLPQHANGGHRLDGLTQQQARRAALGGH